jgi:hypothetical protein
MKKIFTLIAVAAMAISAHAQEKYIIQKDFVPSKGQVVEATTSTTITFSDDPGWKASNPADGGFVSQKDYIAGVTGTQNPKDGGYGSDGKSAGNGYKPDTKNLPNAGVYYIVKASEAGTFELALKVGSGKNFYICDAADGSALANTDITGVNENGALTLSADYLWSGEGEMLVTFNAEANKSYYIICTGSKLTFFGYTFTSATGIESVKASMKTANGETYNIAGQKVDASAKGLVIKNGKKFVNK